MTDKYFEADLKNIVARTEVFDLLENSTVLVTGATGLVGSFLIKSLLTANRGIKVVALVRSVEKAKGIYGLSYEKLEYLIGDINNTISYDGSIDFIFHCAAVTTSKLMVQKPVETLMTSVIGTNNILTLAKEKKVKSMVYVSSMEMYGSFEDSSCDVKETDLGYINPLLVRSNYPESKRLCENMCVAYYSEYSVPVKIARLAQTFGAGILPWENRVFAQFARSVIRGEDIVLHTHGLSEGNYCYSADAVNALLLLLLKGENGEAYNVCNPKSHTTIADMAKMVAENVAENKIKVVFDIPENNTYGYAADTKLKLNSDKLQSLGWIPEVDLVEAYKRLIGSMKDTHNY